MYNLAVVVVALFTLTVTMLFTFSRSVRLQVEGHVCQGCLVREREVKGEEEAVEEKRGRRAFPVSLEGAEDGVACQWPL